MQCVQYSEGLDCCVNYMQQIFCIFVWCSVIWSAVGSYVYSVFTHESSYCFQRVLAIAILSVCLSHGWIRQKRFKLGSPHLQGLLPGRL